MIIGSGEVYVWLLRADVPEDEVRALASLLDDEERAKAARFRFDDDRRRSIVARGALRSVAGALLGGDPRALRFVYGPSGKPALAGGEVELNVSHSGPWVALAAAASPVGIDVECARPKSDLLALARRFFSPPEALAVEGAAPEAAGPAFYSIWTAKESVIKAIGGGLSIDLASFATTPERGRLTPVRNLGHDAALDGWSVLALPPPGQGCYAAVAARGRDWRAMFHQFAAPRVN